MKTAVIIDYGLGNLFSIQQAFNHVGLHTVITADNETIRKADALILPGVGAFGNAMEYLSQQDLIPEINTFVATGKPFMGICLGMQLLFTESEEFGIHKGLNLIEGKVVRFPVADVHDQPLKVPQIQWNTIGRQPGQSWDNTPLKHVPEHTYMHFVHSYYTIPDDPARILSTTEYGGIRYASAVHKDNITGFQYHPEKSGQYGLQIYRDWAASV
jgi:glutamine amidotransferase